jgi:hypothetical protein
MLDVTVWILKIHFPFRLTPPPHTHTQIDMLHVTVGFYVIIIGPSSHKFALSSYLNEMKRLTDFVSVAFTNWTIIIDLEFSFSVI